MQGKANAGTDTTGVTQTDNLSPTPPGYALKAALLILAPIGQPLPAAPQGALQQTHRERFRSSEHHTGKALAALSITQGGLQQL